MPTGTAFRYYIHDRVEAFRLQLIGTLQESRVPELVGCWTTARSILSDRRLILDVSALRGTDEAGREWLLSMVREGAVTLPEDYFRMHMRTVTDDIEAEPALRTGMMSKMLAMFRSRSEREIPVGSSSRAR